jgi:hypothetical protein
MRTVLATVLGVVLAAGTAVTARAAEPTGCPLPLSGASLLGVRAAPDSLSGACDALDGGPGAKG